MIFLNINRIDIKWSPEYGDDIAITTVECELGTLIHPKRNLIVVDCPQVIDEEQAVKTGAIILQQHAILTAKLNRHCLN